VPLQLGLQTQLSPAEGRDSERREEPLLGQPGPFLRHGLQVGRHPLVTGGQSFLKCGRLTARGEEQHNGQGVGRREQGVQCRVALDNEFQAPILGNLLDRPGRPATYLFLSQRVDKPITLQTA
jgi:hypothetical protein